MIFFDLDGTLLDHDGAERHGVQAFTSAFGLSNPADDSSFVELWREVSDRHMGLFLAGEIGFAEQRRLRIREVLGRDLAGDEADEAFKVYLEAYEKNWRLFADVLPCLERLRGTKLGVITNGNRAHQVKKLEATAILAKFAVVVTSEDAGTAKPDPEIFLSACGRVDVPRHDCAYVGDNFDTDAKAATRAGLRGIWLDRAASGSDATGVEVITSLDDLDL